MSAKGSEITNDMYRQDSQTQKIWKKSKESPFVPIGILGMIGMVGYGIYDYKNRGSMPTSMYLMHLRVKAQSMVVGAMTIGVAATLLTNMWKEK